MESRIIQLSKTLKMRILPDSLVEVLKNAEREHWNHEQLLCHVLEKEVEALAEEETRKRIKRAGFTQYKYLEELVLDELPAEAQKVLPVLETLEFVKEGRNVVIYGNPGTGKTHLAIGCAIKACQQGMSVLFTSVPRLLTELREAKSQKKLHTIATRFENYDLVVCDEFGYMGCDKEGGELLFNHLSLRAEKKSTIITTNLAFNRWGEIIKDKILVAALVDRIVHKAHLVNMTGESYRTKETKKLLGKQQSKTNV